MNHNELDNDKKLETQNIYIDKNEIEKEINNNINYIQEYESLRLHNLNTSNDEFNKTNKFNNEIKKDLKKTNNKNKHNKSNMILNIIINLLFVLSTILLIYNIIKVNIIPNKYIFIYTIILLFILILKIIIYYKNKHKKIIIFINIILILLTIFQIICIPKVNELISFFNNNLQIKYETNLYNIIVSSSSNYNDIKDIKGSVVTIYDDLNNFKDIQKGLLHEVTGVTFNTSQDVISLLANLPSNKDQVVIVNSGYYESKIADDETYESKTKILYTITLKNEVENNVDDKDLTKNNFILYLSGIDTRSGTLPSRSLSDVNMIIAVNPTKKNILLVNTPRDSYVQLHGTKGLKDKLTHAGTKGGLKESKSTLEDLYDISIPYYARANFNSVVKLVNAIGGIDIESDTSFRAYGDPSCYFKKGLNKDVKGKCALAYARERHAYSTGDRHRGENQEQVLQIIFNKITSSTVLLSSYSNILKAMDGTFETNIGTENITNLIKMQLDDMATWTFDIYNVDGKGSMSYTNSYPNSKSYVMILDENTIEKAKTKIKSALNNK